VIAIIDYGMGNLRSVEKAFAFLGHQAAVSDDPQLIKRAKGIVLPGVGAFGDAMQELAQRGLKEPVIESLQDGKPFLGICLGYQLLFENSQESPGVKGLGVLKGKVIRFPESVKVPHMGWNDVKFAKRHPILDGLAEGTFYYFVHSYYVQPSDEQIVLTRTEYGLEFASGIAQENILAFQFHPEKSSSAGLRLLHNFAKICA
jgi:glutamine amidotransferase